MVGNKIALPLLSTGNNSPLLSYLLYDLYKNMLFAEQVTILSIVFELILNNLIECETCLYCEPLDSSPDTEISMELLN